MNQISYTALNEQAKILYDCAYAAGRLRGEDYENQRQAHEQGARVLIHARELTRIALVVPPVYAERIARRVMAMLFDSCPTAMSPHLYQIRDALAAARYQPAIDLIEADIAALREVAAR